MNSWFRPGPAAKSGLSSAGGNGPSGVPGNMLAGLAWMVLTGIVFTAIVTIIRKVSLDMHAAESAFLRYLLGLAFILPLFIGRRRRELRTKRPFLQGLRGLLHGASVLLWFIAIADIALAEVTALSFMAPVFATIGAALFLGEKIGLPRIIAVVVGLVGALVILQPGFREISWGHIAMLLSAPCSAGSRIIAKRLTYDESPTAIVAWLSITVTIVLAVPAIQVWRAPTTEELMMLALMALLATIAHYCMTRALQAADLSLTQPMEFLTLIWASLVGIYVFGEQPFWGIWVGGAIIIASATYIARREMLARNRQKS